MSNAISLDNQTFLSLGWWWVRGLGPGGDSLLERATCGRSVDLGSVCFFFKKKLNTANAFF